MAWTDNLSGYWKLNETSGTNADDAHTTNNDGTAGASIVVNQTGKIDKCYLFDGTNASRITLPTVAGFQVGSSDVSFVCWAYPTNLGLATSALLGGADNCFGIKVNTNGTLQVTKVNAADATVSTIALTQSAWNFVAVTFNQTTDVIIYTINGTSETKTGQTMTFTAGATSNLIGQRSSNLDKFIGNIDEVGFWLRALTPDEVSGLYAGGNGLTYPFDYTTTFNAKYFDFSTF